MGSGMGQEPQLVVKSHDQKWQSPDANEVKWGLMTVFIYNGMDFFTFFVSLSPHY